MSLHIFQFPFLTYNVVYNVALPILYSIFFVTFVNNFIMFLVRLPYFCWIFKTCMYTKMLRKNTHLKEINVEL